MKHDQEHGKFIKTLSIKMVISAIAGVVTIIVVIYIAYHSHRKFEEGIISKTQQQLLATAGSATKGLEKFLHGHLQSLQILSNDPIIKEQVHNKVQWTGKDEFCRIRNFFDVYSDDADALYLTDADGVVMDFDPVEENIIGTSIFDRADISYVLRKHQPDFEVLNSNVSKPSISISRPIFYEDRFAGIVGWIIESDTFAKHFVKQVKIGNNGYAWMFDNKNTVLSHPREDFIGMSVLDVIRKMHEGRGAVFDESRAEEHIRVKHGYLNRVKTQRQGYGIFENCVTDENDIVAFKRVSAGKIAFNLIMTMPYSEIVGPIQQHERNTFTVAGIVILLLGAGGLVLLRSEKRKTELETEAKYLKQIANGAKALQQSEERFRQMAENIHEVFWMNEPKSSKMLFVSPAYEHVWQRPVKALYEDPRKWMDYIHKDDLEIVTSNWEEQIKGHPTYEEFRIILPDGSIRWIANRAYPIMNDKGQVTRVTGVAADITDRKHALEQTLKIEAQLHEVHWMEAIATLAGGIAHEFNNALIGVSGNIELLQMDLPDDEKMNRYVGRMKDSTHRMANLTDQLLAYARGGKYQPKTISLNDFAECTLTLIMHSIDPAIRVETDLPRDVSPIEADLTQMQMVLSAVLNNAAEAIEGEGRIRIITRNEKIKEKIVKTDPDLKPGHYVSLTIQDDGKGMDEETRNRVFEPFFTTKFQGRGMGMAAAYGIIKNHGGAISVHSELGKGTTVRIYLPAVAAHVEKEKETKTYVAAGTGTILVIEDEDIVIEVIAPMLERLGYSMLVAKTGMEAVEIAKTFKGDIDLAILDIVLPDISGKEVYPLIIEARPNMKVLVCSGYAVDGPPQEILDAGAQDFIQKPFSLKILSEKLKEVLEGQTDN